MVQKYPTLLSMLGREDPVEVFCFGELHRAIVRLDPVETFADRISLTSRNEIDQSDHMGRTALSWAAELGELDMIIKLLMRGADPNKADVAGRTPLIHCALDINCLTTLLEAGAHVDHTNEVGRTKLNLLIRHQDNVDCAKVLWRFGADVNHRTKALESILHTTVSHYRPHLLSWLLNHEVDVEARNIYGRTPLLYFIDVSGGDGPDMLEILLRKKPDCQTMDALHEGLPHYIARYGSIKYMALFQQLADLSSLVVDGRSIGGFKMYQETRPGLTAMEVAEWRRDHQSDWALECCMDLDTDPLAWFAAFDSWIKWIRAAQLSKMATGLTETVSEDCVILEGTAGTSQEVQLRLPGSYPAEDGEE